MLGLVWLLRNAAYFLFVGVYLILERKSQGEVSSCLMAKLFLSAWIVAIYLDVPIGALPSVGAVFLIAIFFLAYCRKINSNDVFVFVSSSILAVTSIVFSPGVEYLEKLSAFVQFVVALIGFLLAIRVAEKLEIEIIDRILFFALAIIVLGVFLEVLGIVKPLSDSFRATVYPSEYLYAADDRDIQLVGWMRPKLFTSEPSHVVKMFCVLLNGWLLLGFSLRRFQAVLILSAIFALITSSLIIVGSIFLSSFIAYRESRRSGFSVKWLALLGVIFVGVSILYLDLNVIQQRVSAILSMEVAQTSESIRMVLPIIAVLEVLREFPIFGVGFGGGEFVAEISTTNMEVKHLVGSNGLATAFLYYGVLGVLAMALLLWNYAGKKFGVYKYEFIFMLFFMMMSMGAIESVRFWGYLSLFGIVCFVKKSEKNRHGEYA